MNNYLFQDHLNIFLNVQLNRNLMMMLHLLMKQVEQQLIKNLKMLIVVVDRKENLKIELFLYRILLLMINVEYHYLFDEQVREMEDDNLLQLNPEHFYFVLD